MSSNTYGGFVVLAVFVIIGGLFVRQWRRADVSLDEGRGELGYERPVGLLQGGNLGTRRGPVKPAFELQTSRLRLSGAGHRADGAWPEAERVWPIQ